MKILIFGASGFLGSKLFNYFSKENEVLGTCQENLGGSLVRLDATNPSEIEKLILSFKPNLVINSMGITSSLECEKNPILAKKINFNAAKQISELSKKIGAKQVFISSSYVFDGAKGNYNEEDLPNPKTMYGQLKLRAEKEILLNRGIVLRVEIMYGFNGNNKKNGVVGKIIQSDIIEERNSHQKRSPLFVDDVAPVILKLLKENASGVFHVCGPDKIEMYSLLNILKTATNSSVKIVKIDDPHALVKPPKDATMSIEKIKNLDIEITSLEEGLKKMKEQMYL